MSGGLEREIKLRFETASAAREAVVALGATLVHPRRLQADALYDTQDGQLSQRLAVLRIRRDGDRSFVTFKSPLPHATMKLREEKETAVGDASVMARVLEELGLRPWFRYEKYREEFTLEGVVVDIDETPVGTFVEIEGTDHGITAAAIALGRGPADYVLDSYRTLYVNHCAALGITPTHMVFTAA
jgi:adenylate cyclase, class 2